MNVPEKGTTQESKQNKEEASARCTALLVYWTRNILDRRPSQGIEHFLLFQKKGLQINFVIGKKNGEALWRSSVRNVACSIKRESKAARRSFFLIIYLTKKNNNIKGKGEQTKYFFTCHIKNSKTIKLSAHVFCILRISVDKRYKDARSLVSKRSSLLYVIIF